MGKTNMTSSTTYKLMSEDLREKFGDIFIDTVFQNDKRRIGFLRRATDRAILTYHIVHFNALGIKALGKFHKEIVNGGLLGEIVKKSGVPHTRSDSRPKAAAIPKVLSNLFGTTKKICKTKNVKYKVDGKPYVRIEEFYNPEFIPFEK